MTGYLAKSGLKYIVFWGVLALSSSVCGIFTPLFVALFIFALYFFRDPEREPKTDDAAAFLASIDGKVREISIATLDEQKFTKILIEKSLFSVGTLRAPCDMKVEQFRRRHGLFLCGRMKISDALNERALYTCKNGSQNFALRIVAGALSRELDVERVKELRAGRKFGFLGSGTVAFYAPVSAKICVSVGDGLRAGEILGYFDKGSRNE